MAFKGDLKNVQLADLFQTLAQNRQEGVLTLSSRAATHRIAFRKEGVTLLDPAVGGRRRVGEILVSAGLIEEKDLAEALREQAKARRFLGEILIESGKVKKEQLDQILSLQVEEEIYELFRAEAGTFEFTEGDPSVLCATAGPTVRPLPVDQVVFEAARRLDEWGQIQKVIPSIDGVYVATVTPDQLADDDEGRMLLSRLDGRHSVRDASDALLSSPFSVAKVLARLVEQEFARTASTEELFVTARELLTENQKNRALRFLHRLQELNPASSPLDAQLAELFKLAGDPKAAAQTRVKLAAAARNAGKLDSARHELELALREWPGATPVLELLVQVLRDQHDPAAELQHVRELAAALTDAGVIEGALKSMERVLELSPDDAEARRRYADLCLRAHLKEKAVEVLEREAQRLKRDGLVNDLAAVYKRILSIDGGRKDIKRSLASLRRSRTDKLLRLGSATLLVVVLLSLGGLVGLRQYRKSHGLARLQEAASLLAVEDVDAAREIVDSIMDSDPRPEVAAEAMKLLDRIDEMVADGTRGKRSEREEQLSSKLAAIQEQMDRLQFDTALAECVQLLLAEKEPYLANRIETRMQVIMQALLDHVARAKERSQGFRPPEKDEDVGPAYERMAKAFPVELSTSLPRVREVAFEAAKLLEGAPRDWMHQILLAVDAYDLMYAKMKPELDGLRTRHVRLETLQQLSAQYLEAARAAEAGNVERSRELLRKVLVEYGDGELSGMLQQRLARLDSAATAIQHVERRLARGEYEMAYAEATKAAADFKDLHIPSTLSVPVLIDSLPRGARARVDGREAGKTPFVVRVPVGQQIGVDLDLEHCAQQHVDVDASGGARHLIEMERRALAHGRLDGTALAPPLALDGRFAVAGRDGTMHDVTVKPDGTLAVKKHRTGSISGSLAAPVAVPKGFIATVFEGKVYRFDTTGSEMAVVWTRPLEDELRLAPIVLGDEVIVVTSSGRVVSLALADGVVRWQISLGGSRVAGAPALIQGRLFVPLAGGKVVAVSIEHRKAEFERTLGEELVAGLVADDRALIATTSTGRLLQLDPTTAEVRGSVDLGDVAIDLPRVAGSIADVPLGKSVTRVDLDAMCIVNEWRGLAPTATPTMAEGLLWIPCDRGVVNAIDPEQGIVVERAHLGTGALAGSAVIVPEGIALLARDGSFVVLER